MKRVVLSIITILLLSATQAFANYLVRISGENQTAQVGEKFEEPIKIRVQKSKTDETPVPNISVRFVLQKGPWIDFETNPVIASLDLTTDENGEAGVVLTAGNIDEGVYRVRYAIRVTIIGDTRSVFCHLAVIGFNTQEPPTNIEQPPSDQEPPPADNPDPPPADNPNPDPPVVKSPDPPQNPSADNPNPDPPVVKNPDPPRNPPPVDDRVRDPDPPPVVANLQTLDPNEIWHVMYRNDNGRATVFVYPRCFSNPYHSPPKPACENNHGITEELFFQVAPNFAIEIQGNLENVNNMLDLKLAEDNASLVQVGGVQGVVN